MAMRTGTRFWTARCQIPVVKPFKSDPQNEQRISLKNPTNEHLRLASVVGTLLKLRLRRNNSEIMISVFRRCHNVMRFIAPQAQLEESANDRGEAGGAL